MGVSDRETGRYWELYKRLQEIKCGGEIVLDAAIHCNQATPFQ